MYRSIVPTNMTHELRELVNNTEMTELVRSTIVGCTAVYLTYKGNKYRITSSSQWGGRYEVSVHMLTPNGFAELANERTIPEAIYGYVGERTSDGFRIGTQEENVVAAKAFLIKFIG